MLQLLLERIEVIGQISSAITCLMQQLLKLNRNNAGSSVAVGGNQMNHLIETATGGFQSVMGDLWPALLNFRKKSVEAIAKPVSQILGILRRIGWRRS